MDDIGREPDDGRPEGELVECPYCGSTDIEIGLSGIDAECMECGKRFNIGPDPNDYPEYDR